MSKKYSIWDGSTVLITGGTGSFGKAFLKRGEGIKQIDEIRVFSRDEKKQDDLRKQFTDRRIKFIIGDIRDRDAVDRAMKGVDYVFHAAALKHVSTGENWPYETVKTNVIGSNNVIESAILHEVVKVVVLSTDKAVHPVCAMGMTKALMEKCALARCMDSETSICVTRFGNVVGSRNSVIPLFIQQIKAGKPVTVTDYRMIRYMMTMDEAQDLVKFAFEHGNTGDTFVTNSKAASVRTIVEALMLEYGTFDIEVVGARSGEKMIECMLSEEESGSEIELGPCWKVPYLRSRTKERFPKPTLMEHNELHRLLKNIGVFDLEVSE